MPGGSWRRGGLARRCSVEKVGWARSDADERCQERTGVSEEEVGRKHSRIRHGSVEVVGMCGQRAGPWRGLEAPERESTGRRARTWSTPFGAVSGERAGATGSSGCWRGLSSGCGAFQVRLLSSAGVIGQVGASGVEQWRGSGNFWSTMAAHVPANFKCRVTW